MYYEEHNPAVNRVAKLRGKKKKSTFFYTSEKHRCNLAKGNREEKQNKTSGMKNKTSEPPQPSQIIFQSMCLKYVVIIKHFLSNRNQGIWENYSGSFLHP